MKTLVIDDDPFAVKLLMRQLEQIGGIAVTPCHHAKDAVALLEAGEGIDLIFCDLQMPDMDGVEFVRHLARLGYGGALVLVSAEDGRILQTAQKLAQAHQILTLGALAKPVSAEQLRRVVTRHVERSAATPRVARRTFGADELARAIADGELVNHYQPKVDLASGAVVGVEALVRWRHPEAGLIYPDHFIGVAEEFGLIDGLTHAVLRAALQQARRWRDAGLQLQVAVNVSMDNLADLEFPERVAGLAKDSDIALAGLVLEITESRLMKDLRAPLDILTRLRLKRIGLSIDDFGTGHSSLAQLRDIPFDELKLDRSFISGAVADPALRAIVEGTLEMAGQLGMKTVAEGVEDRADWDFLRAAGCRVAQGYFVARPMPGDEVAPWCAGWEARRGDLLTAVAP